MINGKKVIATIQARMTSTRLPGKALLQLAGVPVLQHMIERHKRSSFIDEVVVATTTNPEDDPIVELCKALRCKYFGGSENDVLGRILATASPYDADIIVQGMADSPLVDWRIVDGVIEMLSEGSYDFVSNELEESFPVGFDVRACTYAALKDSDYVTQNPTYREHATYYLFTHPERYRQGNFYAHGDMVWPTLRLTLDTPEDYRLISIVYDELYPKNKDFSAEDVVRFLRARPDLVAINTEVKQHNPAV